MVGGRVRIVDSIRELKPEGREVGAVIVSSRTGSLRQRIDVLARIEREHPWVPVVLVTDPEPDVAKLLAGARVAAVVWFPDLQTELQSRLDSVRATSGLAHLAATFERSELPQALRRGLVLAVRQAGSRPIRNVRELAEAVGCRPVTLFQQFRLRAGGATTLGGFLNGLTILRVHELRRSGVGWKTVTLRTGIHRATANRRVKTWPGCTLDELRRMAPDQLLAAFTIRHVRPIQAFGFGNHSERSGKGESHST